MARFQAGAPYFLHNFRPSTGRGFFDAMYYPPNLVVTVKCRLGFADSDVSGTDPDQGWFARPALGLSAYAVRRADTPDIPDNPGEPARRRRRGRARS
jgi:hypothetical protein